MKRNSAIPGFVEFDTSFIESHAIFQMINFINSKEKTRD